MNTKLDQAFAALGTLITDQTIDLALAMAELDNVAAERDKALAERDASRAGYSAMNTRIYGPGGECHELDKARAAHAALKITESFAVDGWNKAVIERDTARQSLRAAEQEVAETESVNSDLRTVNARLVAERNAMQTDNVILRTVNRRLTADLRAAIEERDTAEAILRAKA